jgi:HlyD family secretion protein
MTAIASPTFPALGSTTGPRPPFPGAAVPVRLPDTNLRRPALLGATALALLVGVLGGWAALTPVAGAVIATGAAVVRGEAQLVQSFTGGVVLEIAVKEGDRVEAGQPLLRLDPTLASANLGVSESRLVDALALRARLEAEREGRSMASVQPLDLPFPAPDTSRQEAAQTRILEARAAVLAGGRARLAEAQAQSDAQLAGIEAQLVARRAQAELLAEDQANLGTLEAEGLVRGRELNDAVRASAETDAQIAALQADAARVRTERRDAELSTLQDERTFRETVETELREAEAEVDGLVIEVVRLRAELERAVLRSPATGIVHDLSVATPGGVAPAGETLLQVVPLDRGLEFTLKLNPRAIDEVYPGQEAEVVLSSLDPRATPRLKATVASVAPGTVTDPATGLEHYEVTLSVPPSEIARLGAEATVVPGMPIEAFLHTRDRSVLSYLVEPVAAHLRHAFRES